MRQTLMTLTEFLNFRKEAKSINLFFDCFVVSGGRYMVEADTDFLDYLGF